jgi:hypothetical protein
MGYTRRRKKDKLVREDELSLQPCAILGSLLLRYSSEG